MEMIVLISLIIGFSLVIIVVTNLSEIKTLFKKWYKYLFSEKIDPILQEKRLSHLKDEYVKFNSYCDKISKEINKNNSDYTQKQNSKCPKCQSDKVNNRIKRIQGDFSGSISGSGSIFGSSLYGSSSGKLDTNEVNKCNDCQNEWKVADYTYQWSRDKMEWAVNSVYYYLSSIENIKKTEFDKKDLSEKYNSLEEKKSDLLTKAINGTWRSTIKEYWNDHSIEFYIEMLNKYGKSYMIEDLPNEMILSYSNLLQDLGMKHLDELLKEE